MVSIRRRQKHMHFTRKPERKIPPALPSCRREENTEAYLRERACEVDICPLLGCYAAPMFRDNASVSSSTVKKSSEIHWHEASWDFLTLEDGSDTLSRSVGKDYHSMLRNTPEQRRSHQHRDGSLKSRRL
jgi:hypothetical protein